MSNEEVSSSAGSAATASTGAGSLSGTTQELFRIWQGSCLRTKDPATQKDMLRQEARSVFQSLVAGTEHVVTSSGGSSLSGGSSKLVLKTKASHEEALALLIQELGPAFFADRHACRICALSSLTGAIEGCKKTTLSNKIVNLLGTFLLGHCGPIEQEDSNNDGGTEDYDEQIRDAAVVGLTALLSGGNNANADKTLTQPDLVELVRCRLRLAQTGVERRCAAPELDDDDDNKMDYSQGYGTGSGSGKPRVQSGLATLPRSRRALLFTLLQSLVDGVTRLVQRECCPPSAASALELESELVAFGTFIATCLHGESDPRCLMQLLLLFSALLPAWQPFFSVAKSCMFPVTDIFDAVAPYYPVQFTPPPNDVHGITKAGLRQALLSVISYTGYDDLAVAVATDTNDTDMEQVKDTMLHLTLGIVLERVVPPEEDGPSTMSDKLGAFEDLVEILFSTTTTGIDGSSTSTSSKCDKIDVMTLHELANTFLVVHDEASMAFSQGGAKGKEAKEVADLCRTIVARVALDLEQASDKTLWETFVLEPLRSLSSRLASSPSHSRTAIAYVACLCASGGPKTLRCSLESALVPLFHTVSSSNKMKDTETADVVTAVFGIGAFFSSCRVALEKAKKNGIVIHPHPLANYCGSAVDKLVDLLTTANASVDHDHNHDWSIQTAAVRAMESVLVVSPAEHFSLDQVQKVTRFVESILETVMECVPAEMGALSRDEGEWRRACAETAGSLLGTAMDAGNGDDNVASERPRSIVEVDALRTFLLEETFPKLVSFVGKNLDSRTAGRYETKALALAASSSLPAASRIVGFLVESLHAALQEDSRGSSAQGYAAALSFILRHGESLASKAYFELAAPSVTPIDILDALAPPSGRTEKKGGIQSPGMSMLQLPKTTAEDREKTIKTIDCAYDFIPHLLPAYQNRVSRTHLEKLVSIVSQVLPPLDESDTVKLSVYLPFLSAAIEHAEPPPQGKPAANDSIMEGNYWTSMIPELAQFALSVDNYPSARSHAVASLHAMISRLIPKKEPCPSLALLRDVVLPSFQDSLKLVGKETDKRGKRAESLANTVSDFIDGLALAAVLGSAAACRGGTSSKTADRTVVFLVDLACSKESAGNFDDAVSFPIDLTVFDKGEPQDSSQVSTELAIAAASALGSIISTEGGSPLLKQRLTHISVKRIVQQLKDATAGTKSESQPLAVLAVVSQVICSSSLRNIADSDMQVITGAVVAGLSSISSLVADTKGHSIELVTNAIAVKKIVLAAVVKIICTKQTAALSRSIYFVVTGLMRAYAVTVDSDPVSEIACKLLALQGLATVIRIEGAKETLQAVQKAVVSLLSAAMNHPSSLLRHAAVDARNAWFLLD